MLGKIPSILSPRGGVSFQGLMQLASAAQQFGMSGGPDDSIGPQGIVPKPQQSEAFFAIIDDANGNVHAWTEANVTDPDNVARMAGGRFGTISGSNSSTSSNEGQDHWPAYDFSGTSHANGTVVYIVRITHFAWGIICCSGDSSSDPASFCFEVDCDAGTIIVTDCTESSSGSSSSSKGTGLVSSSDRLIPKGGVTGNAPAETTGGGVEGV